MISYLLQSKSRENILVAFLLNGFSGSIRAVAKKSDCSPMQASYELGNLENAGILKSERIANAKIYATNEKCSFIDELRALIAKTAEFEVRIKKAIENIHGVQVAFIYGSYANGTFKPDSDIDLFIIGTPDMNSLHSRVYEVQKEISHEINISIYEMAEFKKRRKDGFIKNVLANKKIMIVGEASELG
ncbi:MAG: nucleotidyltransferase domain-containing protein [Candidatus Micrarchaeia archaeon]